MKYYEINFYGENDVRDYSWYIKNKIALTDDEVKKEVAKNIGYGLTQEDLDNIVSITEISAYEFTSSCGIEA